MTMRKLLESLDSISEALQSAPPKTLDQVIDKLVDDKVSDYFGGGNADAYSGGAEVELASYIFGVPKPTLDKLIRAKFLAVSKQGSGAYKRPAL